MICAVASSTTSASACSGTDLHGKQIGLAQVLHLFTAEYVQDSISKHSGVVGVAVMAVSRFASS